MRAASHRQAARGKGDVVAEYIRDRMPCIGRCNRGQSLLASVLLAASIAPASAQLFVPHPTTPSFGAGDSFDVELGDLDGNGTLDAVIANWSSQANTVWLSDGAGNFTPHPTTPTLAPGVSTLGVALGDIDGDGDLDAVFANDGPPMSTWLNDGAGSFSPHPTTPSFGGGRGFEVGLADLDGDGDLDAARTPAPAACRKRHR